MAFRFQISANLLTWPSLCACCGGQADTKIRASASRTTGKRVQHTTTSSWEIPYCSQCIKHKEAYESAFKWLLVGLLLGLVVWFFIAQISSTLIGFFIGIIVALLGILPYAKAKSEAEALMRPRCSSVTSTVKYVAWHGTVHTFIFASKSYLDLFLAANSSKNRSDITNV